MVWVRWHELLFNQAAWLNACPQLHNWHVTSSGFPRFLESPWKYLNFFLLNSSLESTWKQDRCLKVLDFILQVLESPWIHQVKLCDICNVVKQHLHRTRMHILYLLTRSVTCWQCNCRTSELNIYVTFVAESYRHLIAPTSYSYNFND